jgi:AraC-like DNA-binding protein
VDGLSGGAQAYLTKPFDAEVLRAQIDSLIDAQRQLRSHVRERRERAPIPGPSSADAEPPTFGARVRRAVRSRLSDADLTVEELAEEVGCTRRTLTRKVKAAFGQSPSALIRTMRLEKGADLLEREEGSVSEIAYAVGFNSLSYFSRRFKKHFGVSPTSYRDDASPDAPTSASTGP